MKRHAILNWKRERPGDEATEAAMSTHRMGRDRFPYGPAQPEELPPETHWMDYDTLEEVRT